MDRNGDVERAHINEDVGKIRMERVQNFLLSVFIDRAHGIGLKGMTHEARQIAETDPHRASPFPRERFKSLSIFLLNRSLFGCEIWWMIRTP